MDVFSAFGTTRGLSGMMALKTYYCLKPLIPRALQIMMRRWRMSRRRRLFSHIWPIDYGAGHPPAGWHGWPENKRFALVLKHDVDTASGQARCLQLAQMEIKMGFRSSFNFVPERYEVSSILRQYLKFKGFEVGVHGLKHDGRLYLSRKVFEERAPKINHYLKAWGSVGFCSPASQHNLEWICDLDIQYDSSTFDTDPFEPQPEGVRTVFPFLLDGKSRNKRIVELPYTLPQDFTLFVLGRERNIDIWTKKLDWIASKRGMVLLNTHPDYMQFRGEKVSGEKYPAAHYEEFLEHTARKFEGQYWHVLPRDMAGFWLSLHEQPGVTKPMRGFRSKVRLGT